jgi:hypothetical protein
MQHYGYDVVPAMIALNGLTMTPTATGAIRETQRKYEITYFGFAAQWLAFRAAVLSRQLYLDGETSLMELFVQPRFTLVDY